LGDAAIATILGHDSKCSCRFDRNHRSDGQPQFTGHDLPVLHALATGIVQTGLTLMAMLAMKDHAPMLNWVEAASLGPGGRQGRDLFDRDRELTPAGDLSGRSATGLYTGLSS
jgi:hypothetical protein